MQHFVKACPQHCMYMNCINPSINRAYIGTKPASEWSSSPFSFLIKYFSNKISVNGRKFFSSDATSHAFQLQLLECSMI